MDFEITAPGEFSDLYSQAGCGTFTEACRWTAELRYGRNSDRSDFKLIFSESRGTCSSKHGALAYLALEQGHPEVEIIAGIFMMSGETHPVLHEFFSGKPYVALPECHCYLRIAGERLDFTSGSGLMQHIAPKIVREQRMDPHQAAEWKEGIHRNFIDGWLRRNPQIGLSADEIWAHRERCITLLSEH
jgi:hypothetical protein